jgi:hypothetical protein
MPGNPSETDSIERVMGSLFDKAKEAGDLEYLWTLLRITGIQMRPDPLLAVDGLIDSYPINAAHQTLSDYYEELVRQSFGEPINLIANLVRCVQGSPYSILPFPPEKTGSSFFNQKPLLTDQISERLEALTRGIADLAELQNIVSKAYPRKLLALIDSPHHGLLPLADLEASLPVSCALLKYLLKSWHEKRKSFIGGQRLYKLPRFEVLELLIDENLGLFGFRIHFSNGSNAFFERHVDSTICTNVIPGEPINFMAGNLDALKPEWHIGNKRLYEIGLPGRYNLPGEWKPIVYPGNSDQIQKDALAVSDDPDVQGIFFYMMCTGHRVIEFVIRTNIDLPVEGWFSFGEGFFLWKCPIPDIKAEPHINQNSMLYDGWFQLKEIDIEYVRSAVEAISMVANRMAFVYNAQVDWILKYRMRRSVQRALAKPDKADLDLLNSIFRNFPTTEESIVLDAAIDWYNHGRKAKNVLTEFLAYYIAMESVAVAIFEGAADFGLGIAPEGKIARRESIRKCVGALHDDTYSVDPILFVRTAYFDCLQSLKKQTRTVVERIFGEDHRFIKALFQKTDSESECLNGLRARIAHGRASLVDEKEMKAIRYRVAEIEHISREFLTRLILRLKPVDAVPSWSNTFLYGMSMADPRTTAIVSDDKALPTQDWRIRSEWLD